MAKEELECSFCGRKKSETNLLIAGLDAHICDRCILQAHGIVLEESKQADTGELSAEMMLKKPKQIKAFLNQYRRAWAAFRDGSREVLFPPGTYALGIHQGVACAPSG